MNASDFPGLLNRSAEWYPLALDASSDRVQFFRLSQADYRAASFLDSRMKLPGSASTWHPWPCVKEAMATAKPQCQFLFHISHVGSTLLARLTGESPRLLSVREPAILRILAEVHPDRGVRRSPWDSDEYSERLSIFLKLWSRTFSPDSTAVIKATSFVSEIAGELMREVEGSRAILLAVTPQIFLMTMLAGAMNDIAQQAENRLLRLHRRIGDSPWRAADLSPGECVAMSWLSETAALQDAAIRFPTRVLWMDFDRFLESPSELLNLAWSHYGAEVDLELLANVMAGPMLSRYAKAPEHAFDANTRQQLLQHAERNQYAEIRKGLEWLRMAARFPAVHAVLDAAANRHATNFLQSHPPK